MSYLLVPTFPHIDRDEMPPYFGLSAGLSNLKNEALISIRSEIKRAIKQVAPPKPNRQPPHNPLHKETGPWLYLGTGPLDPKNAGRWYQIVCFLNHRPTHRVTIFLQCSTCDPAIVQFLTAPLDEEFIQSSVFRNLLNTFHEVEQYFDEEQDDAAITIVESDDEDAITIVEADEEDS